MKTIIRLTQQFCILYLLCIISAISQLSNAQETSTHPAITLADTFSSNMVLQRDKPVEFWGTAAPNQTFRLGFGKITRKVQADSEGNWTAKFRKLPVGGPYTLTIAKKPYLTNLLVGDVWLCSGQSNMEWQLGKSTGPKPWNNETPKQVRILIVEKDASVQPLVSFRKAPQWQEANRETLAKFSAVCAQFAANLQKSVDVPLGLIEASWGGSVIEAWMSKKSLSRTEIFKDRLQLLQHYIENPKHAEVTYADLWLSWWKTKSHSQEWQTGSDKNWKPVPELINWKEFPDPSLKQHNGQVWYAKEFQLTQQQAAQNATLSLGGIDEVDLTWVNGYFVGHQFGWGTPRTYDIPSNALQPGNNLLVLNVQSTWGSAGMVGPAEDVTISFPKGDKLALAQGWQYKPIPTQYGYPESAPWESINGLSGLFNAMLAPLERFEFAGTIWYQGESNTGRANTYTASLQSMIADWRERFGKNMPFVVIQLPNFGKATETPNNSGWAELRNAQWQAVKNDPNSGLVVTIDLGDAQNLHPTNKSMIGARTAEVALALMRKSKSPIHGIYPKSVDTINEQFVLGFAPSNETLQLNNAQKLKYLELCKQQNCKRVQGSIQDNTLSIARNQLPEADRIRYCWADAPVCHLYSRSGLPISSFEVHIQE